MKRTSMWVVFALVATCLESLAGEMAPAAPTTSNVYRDLPVIEKYTLTSRPLDPYTIETRGGSIQVEGLAIDYKANSYIIVDKISFRDIGIDNDGGLEIGKVTESETCCLVRIAELRNWPKEYKNKKILLSGFLNVAQSPQNDLPQKNKASELYPYLPKTPYYFTNYQWELAPDS